MKKKKTGCFAISGCFTIFLFVFVLAAIAISFNQKELKKLPIDTESIVLSRLDDYKPLVETELRDQDLDQYTGLILGMMYQESKGRGGYNTALPLGIFDLSIPALGHNIPFFLHSKNPGMPP